MFNQEPVSSKERKSVNPYSSLIFISSTLAVDLRGHDRNEEPFLLQKRTHLLDENTSIGGIEIGVRICKEQNIHKEPRNPGINNKDYESQLKITRFTSRTFLEKFISKPCSLPRDFR